MANSRTRMPPARWDLNRFPVRLGTAINSAAATCMRYGLVLVVAWIGGMKFTAYEAQAIDGFVSNSPLLSWVYTVASVRVFSAALGILEIGIAILIAVGAISPRLGALGALLAVGMFATTLSFLVSTPGVFEPSAGGFPALTVVPGQFLIKDFSLLAASLFLLGDALMGIDHPPTE